MRVLAVVLLLLAAAAWIAYPKLQDLERYSFEGRTKGDLGLMRARVEAERKATGKPPASLRGGPLLWKTSVLRLPHEPTADVVAGSTSAPRDTGAWGYDASAGFVFVDCTHTDSKLSAWTSY